MNRSLGTRFMAAALILCFSFIAMAAPGPVQAYEQPISVTFNGNLLTFDQQPVIINDRTLVPVRKIFEAMGAYVDYDGANKRVFGYLGDKVVTLYIGSATAYVNDQVYYLDSPAIILNDRTLVPARFIAESLGATVDWDPNRRMVIISKFTTDLDSIPGLANLLTPENPGLRITRTDLDKEIIYGNFDLFVKIPAYSLNEPRTLTIVPYRAQGLDTSLVEPLAAYDVTISGQNSFITELTLEIPYNPYLLDDSIPEEAQLLAAYFDEGLQKWWSIPYEVDSSQHVVRITTDHLTPIMAGVVRSESWTDSLGKSLSNKMAVVEDLLNSASQTIASAGQAVTGYVSTKITELKVMILAWKAASQAVWPSEVVSVYKTDHFHILYSSKDEREANTAGYIYDRRQYQDGDYPGIVYGTNFLEFQGDFELGFAEVQKRYPGQDINKMVPTRIRELGIFLEEAYTNYSTKFKNIETPYTVLVRRGGTPTDKKLSNSMYLPIEYLSDPQEIKVTGAHELFHAFERRYANYFDMTKNNWLMEACAEYASHKLANQPPIAFNSFRNTNMEYFKRPLGTVEALLWTRGEHEYRSAKFIEYLVNHHGLDLPGMLESYKDNYLVNDFYFLEDYLQTKDAGFILGKAYLDFAGYMMLDAAGDVKKADMYPEAYFKQSYTGSKVTFDVSRWPDQAYIPWLAAAKIDIPEKEEAQILITAESPELGLGFNVYLLKGNTKTSGLTPVLELAKEVKDTAVVTVKKGDVIYVLAGNSAPDDPYSVSHTMKGKVTLEPGSISIKRVYPSITRTTKTVTLTPEIKELGDPSKLNFKWQVTSNKGNYLNLNDPKTATFSGPSMTVTLIHENPVEDYPENGPIGPIDQASNPFDVIFTPIDEGTLYTITLTVTDKLTNSKIVSVSVEELVGLKSPMKEVTTAEPGTQGGTIKLP